MQMTLAILLLFFLRFCKEDSEDVLSLHRSPEFGAQGETKGGICESEHCNWRRDRKWMATDRNGKRNIQRRSRRNRRRVGRRSVIFTPRPRVSAWYTRVGTDPALLRGDPGWSLRPARTSPAIKRSDKAAMFICRDCKEKREECRRYTCRPRAPTK